MNERQRWFLGTYMNLAVTAEDSGGRMTVIEQLAARGFSPPLHVHDEEDSVLVVLEGRVTTKIGGEERVLEAGQCGFFPRGVPHTFRVDSDQARMFEICTPGGFERFVIENSEVAERSTLPPPAAPPTDIGPMVESAPSHKLAILGPPMG